MAFINIAEWNAENVADWLKGLDDCILPYVQFFINNNINGCRLLLLSSDDLNNLNVCRIGHQELILEAVDLLKHLHYNFGSETLQSLALRLGCKARSLYNQLKQNLLSCDDNYNIERVSTPTLSGVSDILAAVKAFISWIDRYPFEGQDQYIPVRKTILKLSIELVSTAQRDQFVEKPNDVIKASCITLAELCDRIVQELNDSLAIQPAVLDIVTVKKKPDEELGMHIHSSYSGIHIVGGIKFQSPSHRCGRIEEGDEIVQVNYQTVVGWQLKKLVSTMKEHPTEILLTIKKRPRHSNIMGQVIVLKPFKIPSRKAGHRNSNRVKNAATTTADSDEDDDAFLNDSKHSKPVYPLYTRRPKLPVRRRATISGASPTIGQPPIRIEDLVAGLAKSRDKKENIGRSISHDQAKHLKNLSRGLSEVPSPQSPQVVTSSQVSSASVPSSQVPLIINKSLSSSPKLPYAKVHPFPMEGKSLSVKKSELETTPKKFVPSLQEHSYHANKQITNKSDITFNANEEEQNLLENKKIAQTTAQIGVVNPHPVTVLSYQLVNDIQPKANVIHANKQKESKVQFSPVISRHSFKPKAPTIDAPVLRSQSKTRQKHSSRRVSCKDLGEGDCQGWLYQRKEQHGFLGSGTRWTKRWVVLKSNYLYCYKDINEAKAECLIHLPGFTVSPAPECKSKKYAFKLYNPNTAFHFASDSQIDMSKWMNKMGLAAISYMTNSDLQPEAFCYSETEESEEGSPSINRSAHRFMHSLTQSSVDYRETSPAALSTSSSDTNNSIKEDIYGRSPLTSTSSSSTSNSSSFNDYIPRKTNKITSSASPLIKSRNQQKFNYVRSVSSLEASDIASRNRQQSDPNTTRYAKLIFPPTQRSKGSFSPQITPRALKLPLTANLPDSGSLDRQRYISRDASTGNVTKVSGSYTNLQQELSPIVNKRVIQPPRPLPRTSKLMQKKEDLLPAYVAKINDSTDHLSKPNERVAVNHIMPPTRTVPKPVENLNGEQQKVENTYEYVFKPTMAMIKTGIVNPLYERVQNKSWSGEMVSPNGTGKGRMPLPNEMEQQTHHQPITCPEQTKSCELSILDREYNRLYGGKKPNVSKTATSVEIESLYTSKARTTSSSYDSQSTSPLPPHRPNTPSSSDNSMSSSSGISSYYSTYLEIPAEQMYRIMNVSQTSNSSYNSAKSSPTFNEYRYMDLNNAKFEFDDKYSQQLTPSPLADTSSPQSPAKTTKSPTKSSSFRLFSSPKLLKKLSTPKYQKERHLEKRDVNKLTDEQIDLKH